MPNGIQQKAENVLKFETWRDNSSDDYFGTLVHRGQLNRSKMAKECGFGRSVFEQNPNVVFLLEQLESRLRANGVLPPEALQPNDVEARHTNVPALERNRPTVSPERMRRLEQENAALKAEVTELKRQLGQFISLQTALSLTGRVPR